MTALALRNVNVLKLSPWKAAKLEQPINWKDIGNKTWYNLQDCLNQRTAERTDD